MKYICDCLNVKLHVKAQTLEPICASEHGLLSQEYQDDQFFNRDLALVHLDIEGIQQEYSCLVSHRPVGDWIVAHCINCDISTHAVHVQQSGNVVLINCDLKSGPTYIERLEQSENFSSLYKLVIHDRNDNVDNPAKRSNYEAVQESLTRIQQQLNAFLMAEEAGMEDRIRQFSEAQRAQYADLQSRSRREKNALIRLVLASSQGELEDSVSDDYMPSPASPVSPKQMDQVPKSRSNITAPHNLNFIPERRETRLSSSDSASKSGHMSNSPENDDMFVLDGFEDSYPEPDAVNYDYESDDEENSDSSLSSSSSRDVPVRSIYSSSMPVQVPTWPQKYTTGTPERYPVPTDIAASIKALAQSVREDGTEIFGDLPRRTSRKFGADKLARR